LPKEVTDQSYLDTSGHPTVIGKYRVDGVIGRGAVGIVYRGHDLDIDRPVALKTLRRDVLDEVADRKGLLKRFAREARLAGRCQHPNIVTVYDFVEHEDAPYIVMEHVDAGTLDHVTRAGVRLPVRQVGDVMRQLLSALAHAHGKGVVHRDIKPANILCPAASSIKVTDFGVARFSDLGVTGAGGSSALGTPNYMSPEQFLGRTADGRADIFAAGVILFQLLTGEKPFNAEDLPDLMRKVLNQAAPPVSSFRPECRRFDAVVQKALARNALDRYQTPEEFSSALDEAILNGSVDNQAPLDLTRMTQAHPPVGGESTVGELSKTMAERLAPQTLDAIELALARSIGPIARIVVKRAANAATDAERLLSSLTAEIPAKMEADKFRSQAESWIRSDQGVAAAQLDAVISEAEIASAITALLPFIGPVARLLAERHAATAVGREDFYEHLADAIKDPAERNRFLAAQLGRATGRKS
jgi:serine/threonine-protein kinase